MGGMQVLQWAADYPERLFAAVASPRPPRHSAQNIAFHEVGPPGDHGRPRLARRRLRPPGVRPEKGLAVARMAAHITYLSEAALQRKFGRELQRDGLSWGFDADFQVESYLRHQGASFVDRFDANTYLYITRAHGLFRPGRGPWRRAGQRLPPRPRRAFLRLLLHLRLALSHLESRSIVRALNAAGAAPASSRSRPTRATTPSSWTSRCCSGR